MKSSSIAVIIVIGIILVGGALYVLSNPNNNEQTESLTQSNTVNPSSQNQESAQDNEERMTLYTIAEVEIHNSADDCWTIINGNVYDLTSFIPSHQGGNNILSACGVDATSFFNGERAGQLGGVNNHSNSASARSQLQSLQIGVLAE